MSCMRMVSVQVLVGMLTFVPAQGGTLGDALADFSVPDQEAMKRARLEVLEKMNPGAVSVWRDSKTGHSGQAHLLRSYEQNGMICGEVEHIVNGRQHTRYVLPFCRGNDGNWHIAF